MADIDAASPATLLSPSIVSPSVTEGASDEYLEYIRSYLHSLQESAHSVKESYQSYEPSSNAELSDFVLIRPLGCGGYGQVVLVKTCVDEYYAMKIQQKALIVKRRQVQHVKNEKKILACIDFQFIVKLYYSFKDNANLYIILEFVSGGDFFKVLRQAKKFSEDDTRFYASQVLLALEYLHSADFVYRDLKPENVLVDCNGYLKLTDFGFAKMVSSRTYTFCGTLEYIPPEMTLQRPYGKSADWWAFGMFIYEMLYGRTAFVDRDERKMIRRIQTEKTIFPSYPTVSSSCRNLVNSLLEKQACKRLGVVKGEATAIKFHEWFRPTKWQEIVSRQYPSPCSSVIEITSTELGELPDDLMMKSDDCLFEDEFKDF